MTKGEALDTINQAFELDMVPTVDGRELKYWAFDGSQGRDKGYLNANDCARMSLAFLTLSNELRRTPLAGEEQKP